MEHTDMSGLLLLALAIAALAVLGALAAAFGADSPPALPWRRSDAPSSARGAQAAG
jgi:hypothetical protein